MPATTLSPLSPLDEYRFEAGGWLVLPQVLDVATLARLNSSLDDDTLTTPVAAAQYDELAEQIAGDCAPVRATVDALMWPARARDEPHGTPPLLQHRLLHRPAPLRGGGSDGFLQQWADGQFRDHAKHYQTHHGVRVCMGVRAVWCLDDGSDFLLVPGSHAASAPTPRSVLGQGSPLIHGPAGDAGGAQLPPLRAGDVLLHATNMVWGRRGGASAGRLLGAEFTATNDAQNLLEFGDEPPAPEWLSDLSPPQQTALGWHPSGGNGGDTGTALLSDGVSTWVSPAIEPEHHQTSKAILYGSSGQPAIQREPARHPGSSSAGIVDQASSSEPEPVGAGCDEVERWRFDVSGMLIVRAVMDQDWLAQAHAAITHITGE